MEKLYYDEVQRAWVYSNSAARLPKTLYPSIGFKETKWLELHVVSSLGGIVTPVDLSGKGINSLHVAVDIDLKSGTDPMCRTNTPSGYDLSGLADGIIKFWLNGETPSFAERIDGLKRRGGLLQIKGFDSNGERVLNITPNWGASDHSIYCEGDIDPGTGVLPGLEENYSTTAEMNAAIAAPPVREFSIDGATLWHSTQVDADRYYREQRNGGEWSEAIALVVGPVGPIGLTGVGVAPQGAYDSGTTYALNEGVTYNSSYYRSLTNDNTGNQPDTSPASWELMVESVTGPTGATGATNIDIVTPVIWDENFNAFAYQLSDIDSFIRFGMVKSMSALKLGVVSANPAYTGNAVVYPTTGRTELTQAGWTASTGVAGAYYRDADISGITFVTEDGILIENAASVAGLVAGQWAIGDEDTIGSNRLYVYPTAGNDPTADGDGFYQYDTVSSQTIAIGATPAEITISKSFSNYKCLELWRDTFAANDTLNNGGVVVGMNILDGAEYSK